MTSISPANGNDQGRVLCVLCKAVSCRCLDHCGPLAHVLDALELTELALLLSTCSLPFFQPVGADAQAWRA